MGSTPVVCKPSHVLGWIVRSNNTSVQENTRVREGT